jgi:hypothetical protein
MPKRITRLRIHEASLVDRGANPGAKVLLYKNAHGYDDEEEERAMLQTTEEVDRMIVFSRSGAKTHSWSDRDVSEAMEVLAARLVPDAPTAEQALAKSFGDPDMRELYNLYRSAEAARETEADFAKLHEKTPSELEIERLAREVMAQQHNSWTFEKAVAHILSTPAGIRLYERHRQELMARYARRGGRVL